MAYPFPHRPGSGFCGKADRQDGRAYGTELHPPAIGEVSERVWWAARAAVVEHLGLAEGNVIITPEMADLAREMLAGRTAASPVLPDLHGYPLRQWYMARRAVVELLYPLLVADGTVLAAHTADEVCALLSGSKTAPRLPNARTLRKTKPLPYTVKAPKLADDAVIPF